MKRFTVIIFILFTSPIFGQQINGKITDSNSKAGIPLATLSITEIGVSLLCSENGEFVIFNTVPAQFTIRATATGYGTYVGTYTRLDTIITIELAESHIELEGIQILASRDGIQKDNVTFVESKELSALNTIKATNLGDAISKIPGVYTSTTGTGISKPVIRGLSGTRVITMLNGIRIENQQWGGDHGMGITGLGIGNVEVIKGPASLLYGSDALGGVLYFVDEKYAKNGYFESTIGSSYESNAGNSQTNVGVKLSGKKLRFTAFGGYNSAADFQLPNGNYLVNSRYEDRLFKTALGFGKGNWVSNIRYSYQKSYVGIPGETEDSIVTPLSFQSKVQFRKRTTPFQLIENNFISWENKFFIKQNELSFVLGNTNNSLNEFEESTTDPGLSMNLNSTVYTVKFKQNFSNKLHLTSGLQGMAQINRNNPSAEERLIPNATTLDNGLFTILDYTIQKTTIQTGLRGDIRSISVQDDSIVFSKNYSNLNFSAGILQKLNKNTFRINISSGYRTPHTSELLANGHHDGALRYEIGSQNLKNEQATQLDFTYEFANDHISIIFNPFYNQIQNYIYIQPTDSMIDNLPVYTYNQSKNVQLYGTDLGIHFHPHKAHWLHLEANYSWVKGEQKNGDALPLIPQSRIQSELKIELDQETLFRIENIVIQHGYYFKQSRVTNYETTTSAYNNLNAAVNCTLEFKTKLALGFGIKNILNESYISHLSSLKNIGIPQPGRNYYISLSMNLEKKIKK